MARAKMHFCTPAERVAAWRASHPEQAKAIAKKSREKHVKAINLRARLKYAANPMPRRASAARYAAKHTEEKRLASQAWREANPIRARATVKTYKRTHPEVIQAAHSRRKARKRGAAINDFTGAQWREIKAAYKSCCAYCGRKMKKLTQDHILPLLKGGNHTASNIVPACTSCNSKKGAGAPLVPVQPFLLTIASPRTKKAS